jgi:hypothetical protein
MCIRACIPGPSFWTGGRNQRVSYWLINWNTQIRCCSSQDPTPKIRVIHLANWSLCRRELQRFEDLHTPSQVVKNQDKEPCFVRSWPVLEQNRHVWKALKSFFLLKFPLRLPGAFICCYANWTACVSGLEPFCRLRGQGHSYSGRKRP